MSNHYHVVLHEDKPRAEAWTREELARRWLQRYKGPLLIGNWLKDPAALDEAELEAVFAQIERWRGRLYDISWFMRGVNETTARMVNEEENCKGRFYKTRPCVLPLRAA